MSPRTLTDEEIADAKRVYAGTTEPLLKSMLGMSPFNSSAPMTEPVAEGDIVTININQEQPEEKVETTETTETETETTEKVEVTEKPADEDEDE